MLVNHTIFVVAKEHNDLIIDKWNNNEEEQKRKSDLKREKAVLVTWKKMLMGLKNKKKVWKAYGRDSNGYLREEMNPFKNKKWVQSGKRL